jgi:glutamate 5-kinase
VATEEIRFGDNDQLAAMVAPLVSADLMLLLTDVDGVLDGQGKVLRTVKSPNEVQASETISRGAQLGSGGIASKVDAARKASHSGAAAVIANAGQLNVVAKLLSGAEIGTYFPPHGSALRARKHWIAYTLRPSGAIVIDAGAARALKTGKSSLLPVGVLGVRGQFAAGDSVRVVGPDGSEVGRGLSRLGCMEVARAAGRGSEELAKLAPHLGDGPIVVHKEDLVLND